MSGWNRPVNQTFQALQEQAGKITFVHRHPVCCLSAAFAMREQEVQSILFQGMPVHRVRYRNDRSLCLRRPAKEQRIGGRKNQDGEHGSHQNAPHHRIGQRSPEYAA